jgi:hypothetical protein
VPLRKDSGSHFAKVSVALTERDAARQQAQETKDWLDQAVGDVAALRKKLQATLEGEIEVTAKLIKLQERYTRCLGKARRQSEKTQQSKTMITGAKK